MKCKLKRVVATILMTAVIASNFAGLSFAADNMAVIEFRNCNHGQIVGPERIEVATGTAIRVSDAYVTTFWYGNTDPAAFLYWVLSDPNGKWLHVEGEEFIPTEAKTYTFDLVPLYERFKVRYEANGATGGSVPASSMTYGGNSYNELLTVAGNTYGLTRDGYDFSGWNTSPDGSGTAYSAGDSIGMVAAPQYVTHLYAMWTPKPKYTVTYTCDEAQASISKTSDEVTQGEALVLPQITANRGWRLLGWCSDDGMIEKMPGDTIIVNGNINLKAVLVPARKLALKYDANGAESGVVPADSEIYYAGDQIVLKNNEGNLTKDNFGFKGWNTSADGTGTSYAVGSTLPIADNTTLYAEWAPLYSVTYACDVEKGTSSKQMDTVMAGDSVTIPEVTAKRGWRFIGWCSADGLVEKSPGSVYNVTQNIELKAVFVPAVKIALSYNANGADSGLAPVDSNAYYAGETATIKSNEGNLTKANYVFKNWNTSADGSGTSYTAGSQISLSADMTVYAQWTSLYTVSYNCASEQGTLTKSSDTVAAGESVVLPKVTDKRGWHFVCWQTEDGLVDYASGSSYQVTKNTTLKAKFVPVTPVTITYEPNGSQDGTVPVDTSKYYTSDNITVLNNTGKLNKVGYDFNGWNTKADGSGTAYKAGQTLAATDNLVLFAQWKERNASDKPNNGGGANNAGSTVKPDKDDTKTVSKPTAPVVKVIPKEETPLGKLNAEDHFAYMSGYPDKTFRPNGSITRAEIAMILYRLLDDPNKSNFAPTKSSFKDVKTTAWYGKAVLYLTQMGVLKGDGKGKFNPNAPISRAELATVISKFYELESIDSTPLTDIKGHWAEAYIRSAYAKHWIDAYEDGTYKPNAKMTRVDTLKLINNALNRKVDKTHIPMDEIVRFTDVSEGYQDFEGIVETTNSHLYQLENGLEVWNTLSEGQNVVSK